MNGCDLQFCNLGFAVMCTPESEAGREWVFDNLIPGEPGIEEAIGDCLWPIMIEHRYLENIVLGARDAGLVCHG